MRKLTSFMLAAMMVSACDYERVSVGEGAGEVRVEVEMAETLWTRGTGDGKGSATVPPRTERLFPVNVWLVPNGADEPERTMTLDETTEIRLAVKDGAYDLIAVCGLETEVLGKALSDEIAVPADADFAVGRTRIRVRNGVCEPATVKIKAERQMAWLDVAAKDLPEDFSEFNLYVKGICERYSLARGWEIAAGGEERLTRLRPTESEGAGTSGGAFSFSQKLPPCSHENGVTLVAEMLTGDGRRRTLQGSSPTPLSSGIHLALTLSFGGSGSGGEIVPGEALPGWPEATVVAVEDGLVTFVANEPLREKLSFFKNINKKENYKLDSEIPASRWYIPQYSIEADREMAQTFFALLLESETARERLGISLEDEDVYAYINPVGSISYFDFANQEINIDTTYLKTFRCFVFGEIGLGGLIQQN